MTTSGLQPKIGEKIEIKCKAVPPNPAGWYSSVVMSLSNDPLGLSITVKWDGGDLENLMNPTWKKVETEERPTKKARVDDTPLDAGGVVVESAAPPLEGALDEGAPVEYDWKETIFFWRGDLSIDYEKKEISWKGTWVGSTFGQPEDIEFAESANTFSLTAPYPSKTAYPLLYSTKTGKIIWPPNLMVLVPGPSGATLTYAQPFVAKFTKGSYLLGNEGDGSELTSHSDQSHSIQISSNLVAAKGKTEFGKFISSGYLTHTQEKDGVLKSSLTLGRRYLDDKDKRCVWNLEKLILNFSDASPTTPWNSKSMRCQFLKSLHINK
ncbi:hypothetical protein ScalyP_jg6805 [Parmales sp. scaly parma]|nr:hypothetical protein ScalyP_jg6805 [Parmales sp. scaly parma]